MYIKSTLFSLSDLLFVILFITACTLPITVSAQAPCGTITDQFGEVGVMEDCNNPFGVGTVTGSPFPVTFNNTLLTPNIDIRLQSPWDAFNWNTPPFTQDSHSVHLYRKTGNDYSYVRRIPDSQYLSNFSLTEQIVLEEHFFFREKSIQINLMEVLRNDPGSINTFRWEFINEFNDYSQYAHHFTRGNYALVFEPRDFSGPNVSFLDKWLRHIIPIAHAQAPERFILPFTVNGGDIITSNPPALVFVDESGYIGDEEGEGVEPNKGSANKDELTFKVVYKDEDGTSPDEVSLQIEQVIDFETDFYRATPYFDESDVNNLTRNIEGSLDFREGATEGVLGYKSAVDLKLGFDKGETIDFYPQGNPKQSATIDLFVYRLLGVIGAESVITNLEAFDEAGDIVATVEQTFDVSDLVTLSAIATSATVISSSSDIVRLRFSVIDSPGAEIWIENITFTETLPMARTENTDPDYAVGENFSAASTFPKGNYTYHFTASSTDGLTTRLPETDQLSFVTGYSNVAFLPGVQSSSLHKGTDKLWPPTLLTNNDDLLPLEMNDDGTSKNNDISVGEIIDEVFGVNIYKGFIKFMDEDMVEKGIVKEWQALPYDWRVSMDRVLDSGKVLSDGSISYLQSTSSPYIIQELDRLAKTSDTGKVTIITHSNGGLVAKALTQKLENDNNGLLEKIDKVVFVGVPHFGTPKAVEGLLHGDETQLGDVMDIGILLDEEIARRLAEHMPSAYNLIPSLAYFDSIADPIITFDNSINRLPSLSPRAGSSITSYTDMADFLLGDGVRTKPASDDEESPNVLSSALLSDTTSMHNQIDNWTPPTDLEVFEVAGWGLDTVSGIDYSCGFFTCSSLSTLDRDIRLTAEGDGTVVYPSAVVLGEKQYFVDVLAHNKSDVRLQVNRDHKNILEIDNLQTHIRSLVTDSLDDSSLPQFITTIKPIEVGVRKRITLRSPVAIGIRDNEGRYTGLIENPQSDIRRKQEEIPNSYYREMAGHKYLGLDGRDTYTIDLQGEDTGTFTLEIEDVLHDEVVESAVFRDIPVTKNTKGTLTVSENIPVTLSLDIEGDGLMDIEILANTQTISISIEILIAQLKHEIGNVNIKESERKKLLKEISKIEKHLTKGKIYKINKEVEKIQRIIEKAKKKGSVTISNARDLELILNNFIKYLPFEDEDEKQKVGKNGEENED
jgi:pimeloyl-ACP methyl ester carboxylesterase